ncbi:cytochrome P450 [Planotetraspora sp. GP83]|uniref:cytochrome P450 n=1 Tax=Planotetraspora sp. GP83 TaxID=3156264 RepID=UPI0035118A57
MTPDTMLKRITDYGSRADPYPLYAELRKTPVARQEDGTYVVSTYWEILSLLHDPRISSDRRNLAGPWADPDIEEEDATLPPAMIRVDPPAHDRLRRQAMRPFGPPHSPEYVDSLRPKLAGIVGGLIDAFEGKGQVDIVDDFAYPFPVTVICRILGVPPEDEPRFRGWVDLLVSTLDMAAWDDPVERQRTAQRARLELGRFLGELVAARSRKPGDDMLSALVTDRGPDGPMSQLELISTAVLLLVAGHETTVNLITNGMLTLLRHPDVLERLRREPELAVGTIEELLRYEPPVHLLPQRVTLADIEVAGVPIPKGAPMTLVLGAGNRDPLRFDDPDRFDPERRDNQHLGFGSGVHICFGAPLARLEGQIALVELARRLQNPRLVTDPPPYRQNPVLRGPRHLLVKIDGIAP